MQEEIVETRNNLAIANGGGGGGGGGAVVEGLRNDLAEIRASLKSKTNEMNEAVTKAKDLEKKNNELNEQLMRSHFEKREGESDKTRAAEEVFRLSEELANSRKTLELKNNELSMALSSFAQHQEKAEERSKEMSKRYDDRICELVAEKSNLMSQCSDMQARIQIAESEADNLRESSKATKSELDEIRGDYADMKRKYENEKTLRAQLMGNTPMTG